MVKVRYFLGARFTITNSVKSFALGTELFVNGGSQKIIRKDSVFMDGVVRFGYLLCIAQCEYEAEARLILLN